MRQRDGAEIIGERGGTKTEKGVREKGCGEKGGGL